MMGTTASQVRQDFNCFGGFGQQGIGYKVDVLLAEISKLLFGDGALLPTILIGAGRLGTAVSSFISRDTNGYRLLAVFDINPDPVSYTHLDVYKRQGSRSPAPFHRQEITAPQTAVWHSRRWPWRPWRRNPPQSARQRRV